MKGRAGMSRVALTDGSNVWFETKSAVLFKEDTRWNGQNHISVPTGSQWEHEWLYYTKSGKWVLHEYSQWQGSLERYAQINESEAIDWLVLNNTIEDEAFTKLPKAVQDRVLQSVAAAEI